MSWFFCEKRPFGWGFTSWDSPLPLDTDPGWELSHTRNAVPGLAIPHDTPGKCGSFVISLHRGKEKQAHQMNQWQGQNSDRNCDQGGRGRISVLWLHCPLSVSRSPSWCGHSRRKGQSPFIIREKITLYMIRIFQGCQVTLLGWKPKIIQYGLGIRGTGRHIQLSLLQKVPGRKGLISINLTQTRKTERSGHLPQILHHVQHSDMRLVWFLP